MADPILLMALAEIAMPDYRTPEASMLATVKSATSRYKSCQANGGTYFPFSDGAVIASFDERIKTDYGQSTGFNSGRRWESNAEKAD